MDELLFITISDFKDILTDLKLIKGEGRKIITEYCQALGHGLIHVQVKSILISEFIDYPFLKNRFDFLSKILSCRSRAKSQGGTVFQFKSCQPTKSD